VTTVSRTALLPYSAGEIYDLVDDIESYPIFLPWCKSATVLSRTDDEVRANLELSRSGINKSFTTCNRQQRNKIIEMRLVEGPFHHLEGFWRFDSLGDLACKVSLDLEFEFSSRLLSLTVGPVFNQIAGTLVDSFCKRAVDVYGKR
jgi:ribosome-associated toxin RatA of RatAB toxin-antitoxin module